MKEKCVYVVMTGLGVDQARIRGGGEMYRFCIHHYEEYNCMSL